MSNCKVSKLFDVEQQIMRCWDIVEDLMLLADTINDGSNHTDTVKGIAEVYNLRFEKLWECYEAAIKEKFEEVKQHELEL